MPSSSTLRSILLATLLGVGVPLAIPSTLFAAPQSQSAKKAKAKTKHSTAKSTPAKAAKRSAQVSKAASSNTLAAKKPAKARDEFDSVPPPAGLPEGEAPARSSRSVTAAASDDAPAPTHRRVVVAAGD
jgi:hypothetical protein